MEQTIIIKPSPKTIAVLKKMTYLKEEYRKIIGETIAKKAK